MRRGSRGVRREERLCPPYACLDHSALPKAVMSEYVWQHDLKGEADRLRLMSSLLDPSSRFHLLRTGVTTGWRCLEIGAGNGSLSQWLAQRVGPAGHVVASDIRIDLMDGIADGNLEVRQFDVMHDEPPG